MSILSAVEYPSTEERPWALRLTYGLVGGVPAVVGVEMYAVEPKEIREAVTGWPDFMRGVPKPAHPITAVGIRLPLGRLLSEYVNRRRRTDAILAEAHPMSGIPAALRREASRRLRALDATAKAKSPGRPQLYDSAHFKRVASCYERGLPTGTRAVAEEFNVSKSAAAKWVARARELGLLPATVRGRPSGWQPKKGRTNNAKP